MSMHPTPCPKLHLYLRTSDLKIDIYWEIQQDCHVGIYFTRLEVMHVYTQTHTHTLRRQDVPAQCLCTSCTHVAPDPPDYTSPLSLCASLLDTRHP